MTGQKPRVLIVEDEQAIADTLIYALRTEGFETHHCLLGGDALAMLSELSADFVVLDVGLPDMSGFDVCRELRRFSDLPLLFLTARGDEIDRIVGLELGADDYVVKPFSPREVAVRVKRILRRIAPNQPAQFAEQDSPFQVDSARRTVAYHGQPLDLTRYEYELLLTLIETPGRIYSRAQLMQRVWTHPDHSLERTVDTHIKTLRAKLRAVCPQTEPIRTHRGIGYSLETL